MPLTLSLHIQGINLFQSGDFLITLMPVLFLVLERKLDQEKPSVS